MLNAEGKQGWYAALAELDGPQPHLNKALHCLGKDGGRCHHGATEMHRSRVVEPDAGRPRRGARRAARALPPTNDADEATVAATRRP